MGVTLFSGGMEGDQSLPTQYKGGDCRKLIPIKGGGGLIRILQSLMVGGPNPTSPPL